MIGGGTGNMAIGVSIFLRDRFSANARSVSASARQLKQDMAAMNRQQMSAARNMNAAGAAIGLGTLNIMRNWVKQGAEYGYTMKYVTQLAKGSASEVDALDRRAKMLGQTTMFSTNQVASGMRYMAMAGMNAKQVYDNVGAAVNMSIATMTELGGKGGGADIMTNVMSAFQIGSENAARVADVMTTATTSANTSLFDLGEAMKYAASTSEDLSIGLEETAAMIMMAGNAGIQGSMAGTAIENMIRYVSMAAGGDRRKATEALGIIGLSPKDLKDAKGNLLPIGQLMDKIGKAGQQALGSGNEVQKQNILMRLFGVRGKREGSLMLRNMQDYHTFLNKLNTESGGAASRIAEGMMDTPMGRMKQMTDTWENFKIAFSEALTPVLVPLLRVLTKVLQGIIGIMSTPFGKFLTMLGVGWVVVKTATMAYRAAVLSVRLATTSLGTATMAATGQAAAGWNSATAAAMRYGSAMNMASMSGGMTRMTMGPSLMQNAAGRFVRSGTGAVGRGTMVSQAALSRYSSMYGRKAMPGAVGRMGKGLLGRAGGLMKGGSGVGLLGMGVGMLGDSIGGNVGQGLGVAGDAMSYAGMGAMLGSVIPGLGTAVGAVAGGLYGLVSGLLDWEDSNDENTEAIDANTEAATRLGIQIPGAGSSTGLSNQYWQSRLTMMDNYGANQARYPITNDILSSFNRNANADLAAGGKYSGDANKVGEANIVVNVGAEELFRENNIKLLQGIAYEAGVD